MAENTKIEWCDATFNPWEGCQKVGPGCDNCYAETRNARFNGSVAVNWGPGAPRRRTKATSWRKPEAWNRAAADFEAEHGRRMRVFCASLADVFDNAVDPQWRADLIALIYATPDIDWLLLTKRIGNVQPMLEDLRATETDQGLWRFLNRWLYDDPPHNVWLGATVCNQDEANRDIPKLLATPAEVRFLSMEPLLGHVDLTQLPTRLGFGFEHWKRNALTGDLVEFQSPIPSEQGFSLPGVDWVIVGGESGPGARPMHPDWARALRDQCAAAGVPFLFKQWGEWTPGENVDRRTGTVDTASLWAGSWHIGCENLASTDGHIDDEPDLYRVGKKAAGRHLDGVTHDGFPEVRHA